MRYFHFRREFLPLVIAALLATGCEHPVEADLDPTPQEPTFANVQQIFSANCAGCHSGQVAPHGLDLTAGQSYNLIVNIPSEQIPGLMRVEPGDPENSYLLMKIKGAPGIQQGRMPLGGQPLPAASINLIEDWIDSGAPQN